MTEEKGGYEIFRCETSGEVRKIGYVEDVTQIGTVVDADRKESIEDAGWYKAVYVKGEKKNGN